MVAKILEKYMWSSSFLVNLQACRLIADNFTNRWTRCEVFFNSVLSLPHAPPCIDSSHDHQILAQSPHVLNTCGKTCLFKYSQGFWVTSCNLSNVRLNSSLRATLHLETVSQRCSIKKENLKSLIISQQSQDNRCARVFLNNIAHSKLQTLSKTRHQGRSWASFLQNTSGQLLLCINNFAS